MLNFHDPDAAIDETTFVTGAALEQARLTIADHERTHLIAEDRAVVLAALEAPPEPTEALREAMALHEERVARDV